MFFIDTKWFTKNCLSNKFDVLLLRPAVILYRIKKASPVSEPGGGWRSTSVAELSCSRNTVALTIKSVGRVYPPAIDMPAPVPLSRTVASKLPLTFTAGFLGKFSHSLAIRVSTRAKTHFGSHIWF